MKNTDAIIIRIPEPCNEDWNGMTPNGCGRFCAQCSKTVVDFSVLSDDQVFRLLTDTTQQLCGSFLPGQLDRPIYAPPRQKDHPAIRRAATAAVFLAPLLSVIPAWSQSRHKQQTVVAKTKDAPAQPIRISGTITDAYTRKPLTGMEISIPSLGKKYSDKEGRFSFVLPDSFIGKQLSIFADYQPSSSARTEHSILMEESLVIDSANRHYTVQLFRYPLLEMGKGEDENAITGKNPQPETRITGGSAYTPHDDIIIVSKAIPQRETIRLAGTSIQERIERKPGFWKRCTSLFRHKKRYN